MRPIIGAVALGALVVGGGLVLANARHSPSPQPYAPPAPIAEPIAPAPAAPVASFAIADTAARPVALPVAQTTRTRRVVYRNGVAYRTAAPARTRVVTHTRSTKHSVEI